MVRFFLKFVFSRRGRERERKRKINVLMLLDEIERNERMEKQQQQSPVNECEIRNTIQKNKKKNNERTYDREQARGRALARTSNPRVVFRFIYFFSPFGFGATAAAAAVCYFFVKLISNIFPHFCVLLFGCLVCALNT